MASTNFKIFDENATNMLSDGDYASNTQRTGGVQSGVASSQLQNKFQHQMSYMAKAIADMIVEKGYTITDAENYSNFADKVKKGISDFTFTDHDPTSADIPVKEGQFLLSDVGGELKCFIAYSVSPVSWVKLFTIAISSTTEVIEESQTWQAPNAIGNSFQVTLVGGGAGASDTHGGSGAALKKGTFTIQEGNSISIVIGQAGGSSSNGGTSSFGTLLSAVGGNTSGNAPTDGMGGGGGNWLSASGSTAPSGGNGGTYGGGGGGGGAGVSSYNIVSGGNGGNGGTYGGGGGGCNSNNETTGGNGGTYGGKGGNGKSSKAGQNGTNTVGMNLDFTGTGLGGGTPQDSRSGGSGGGGYGGNGAMVPYRQSNHATGGCGGGGYGGDGGSANDSPGGGGGGYGGSGGNSQYSPKTGGGGGGYGSTNYGCGGGGTLTAKSGVCIITYQIPTVTFNE